jgi:hypothetical protein
LPSGVVEVRAGFGGEGRLGAVRHFPDGCREGQAWLGTREAGPAPLAADPTTVVQVRNWLWMKEAGSAPFATSPTAVVKVRAGLGRGEAGPAPLAADPTTVVQVRAGFG